MKIRCHECGKDYEEAELINLGREMIDEEGNTVRCEWRGKRV